MSHRLQFRRDTKARWLEINPILMEGEYALETDTKCGKIGDGVHKYSELEYSNAIQNITQDTSGQSETLVMSQKATINAIVNKIKLSNIDLDITTIGKIIIANTPCQFVVMSNGKNVGILHCFSDDNQHMLTQVFNTHYLLPFSNNTHTDNKIYQYFRSYHLSGGTSSIPTGTWGEWKLVFSSDINTETVKLGEEDTSSVPVALEVTADYANKALKDFDGNDLRKAMYMSGVLDYEEFSTSKEYAVGKVVSYMNKAYKFIAPHSAGAWDESQVEETNIRKEVKIYQFKDSEGNKVAPLVPEKAVVDKDGVRLEQKLEALNVETIKQQINTAKEKAIEEVGASSENLTKNVGLDEYETFNEAKEYPAGYTLLKDGLLYTFITDHAAGAWNPDEVEDGSIKKEVSNINIYGLHLGAISKSGFEYIPGTQSYRCTKFISINEDDEYVIDGLVGATAADLAALAFYNGAFKFISSVLIEETENGKLTLNSDNIPSGAKYIRAVTDLNNLNKFGFSSKTSISTGAILDGIVNQLNDKINDINSNVNNNKNYIDIVNNNKLGDIIWHTESYTDAIGQYFVFDSQNLGIKVSAGDTLELTVNSLTYSQEGPEPTFLRVNGDSGKTIYFSGNNFYKRLIFDEDTQINRVSIINNLDRGYLSSGKIAIYIRKKNTFLKTNNNLIVDGHYEKSEGESYWTNLLTKSLQTIAFEQETTLTFFVFNAKYVYDEEKNPSHLNPSFIRINNDVKYSAFLQENVVTYQITVPANYAISLISLSNNGDRGSLVSADVFCYIGAIDYILKNLIDISQRISALTAKTLKVWMPEYVYMLEGTTIQIFKSNIAVSINPDDYELITEIKEGAKGYNRNSFYEYNVSESDSFEIKFGLRNSLMETFYADGYTKFIHVNKGASPSENKNVLVIGDSFTDQQYWVAELRRLLTGIVTEGYSDTAESSITSDNLSNITFIGTQDTDKTANEGYSGMHYNFFATDGSEYGKTNPFWNSSANDGQGGVDFTWYCQQHSYSKIDYAVILLGTNYQDPDESVFKVWDALLAHNPNIKVIIACRCFAAPYGPGIAGIENNQTYLGLSYGVQEKNAHYQELCKLDTYKDNFLYVDYNVRMDCMNNMPYELQNANLRNPENKIKIATDNVHPAKFGYWQIADAIRAAFHYWCLNSNNLSE